MKYLIISVLVFFFVLACKETQKKPAPKYPPFFGPVMQGNVHLVENSYYTVDSAGNHVPDAIFYGHSELSDGYFNKYTETDTSGKKKTVSIYTYYSNGHLKSIKSDHNGKTIYRLEVQLDKNGRLTTAQSYDSTGKVDAYNTDLKENEDGLVASGKLFTADSSLINTFAMEYAGKYVSASKTWDSAGRLSTLYTARLQPNGNIISDTTRDFGKDSTITTIRNFNYENYDSYKNWQQKTELTAGNIPVKIIKRKITYSK